MGGSRLELGNAQSNRTHCLLFIPFLTLCRVFFLPPLSIECPSILNQWKHLQSVPYYNNRATKLMDTFRLPHCFFSPKSSNKHLILDHLSGSHHEPFLPLIWRTLLNLSNQIDISNVINVKLMFIASNDVVKFMITVLLLGHQVFFN